MTKRKTPLNPIEIGKRFELWRETKGLTKVEIARNTTISRSTIQKLADGERIPALSTLSILDKYYGLSVDWLMKGYSQDYTYEEFKEEPPIIKESSPAGMKIRKCPIYGKDLVVDEKLFWIEISECVDGKQQPVFDEDFFYDPEFQKIYSQFDLVIRSKMYRKKNQ